MDADAGPGRDASSDAPSGRGTGGVDLTSTEHGLVVAFWGVVDDVVRDRGTADLWELRAPGGTLEIDCSRVTAMDSIGLSILVRLVRDAVEDDQRVRFTRASAPVAELLATSGVRDWMLDLGVEVGP
ncbi:lipid asymmetry maintenance protein MlaB [Cellulomonas fimi]|uniref:STAS domain-containing protein n=1 Tax=Cellulomonas fimi TaxID=1708 RepID=A0A7Y0M0H4_CELFI|nr:STAS domain-containing protein [Cellulomonas fimi]NMR21294.1 STAS domain-containing protein [Cellulomonas fimi]